MFYSTIYCPECRRENVVYDPFTFLSVPVKICFFSQVTLTDYLKSFIQQDNLDENNKWYCENCKQKVRATKTMGIERCSKFLIIHFKRFEYDGVEPRKIVTNVQYPDELDLSDFCKNDRGKLKLISVIFHLGNASSGHYTCASREEGTDKWFYYNDSLVNPIDQAKAHSEDAYILIYQKI
ncbi:Clan CA, family C19, ubiquitin hydrolase-like cysteine peptidase [Trichomonas vaginalis G3]|uniref:ubiquitinyl hydrolase 1 n=1 Tax=Trichomonas vaginalis (strain ATCC PRA-98 / G3) TaxID=412133 RepID=A2DYQ2_TRIV3|nr:ubiquitinyl hydrolase protein [Trichomonas vaginalis G3]EAY14442.1 Clan CA, family C19, ubiquitin hydrolase-like cysteine peptidase [Trichomonas vaginalis G3]KAI5499945.1 ubiquitinyl hydrolase protein [Trichomonas vaginalis G3]|eukprot:XP_001326665.1 Clan CA, family C19, ubiquitin hydrolase-like cysteine peptidase [Trichomonas vaginalis G3]